MRGERPTIAGNGIGGLVAALALAERGTAVTLVNPTPVWAPHFRGTIVDGNRFDYGMVFFEFTSFNASQSTDFAGYEPAIRNDSGRFTQAIARYVSSLGVAAVPAPTPSMWLFGGSHEDFLIANRLESLTAVNQSCRNMMAADLEPILASADKHLHPSRKASSRSFDSATLEEASLANHGATFHEMFMEPFAGKVLNASTAQLLGRYHRAAWLPLFYPETLARCVAGQPSKLQPTAFHYPAGGSFGVLVDALVERVLAHPAIRVESGPVSLVRREGRSLLVDPGGNQVGSGSIAWTGSQEVVAAGCRGNPEESADRASIGFCFLATPAAELGRTFSTLLIPDPGLLPYRISNQTVSAGMDAESLLLSAEFNLDVARKLGIESDEEIRRAVSQSLLELGVIRTERGLVGMKVARRPDAIPLPTAQNAALHAIRQEIIRREHPDVGWIGPSSGFASTSLNDQIIQGLKFADTYHLANGPSTP